jgi:succinylarginine dihydrolase
MKVYLGLLAACVLSAAAPTIISASGITVSGRVAVIETNLSSEGGSACQAVTTSPVTVLAANTSRAQFSLYTTAGAATIYFDEGATAAVAGSTAKPLLGGQSFTDDGINVFSGSVSAITKAGTAWVCALENTR